MPDSDGGKRRGELRLSTSPAKWRPMKDADLAGLIQRYQDGRLSDLVDVRRYELLRLLAEIERRKVANKSLKRQLRLIRRSTNA